MSDTIFWLMVSILLITFIGWMSFCFYYVFKDLKSPNQYKNSGNESTPIFVDRIEGNIKELSNSRTFYSINPNIKGDIANVISGPICLCSSGNRNVHWVTEVLGKCQNCGGFYYKPEK